MEAANLPAMVYCVRLKNKLIFTVLAMFWSSIIKAAAAPPLSQCYALDRNNYLYDFTDKIGKVLEFRGQDGSDFVVRFCQDVQNRSQDGYVNFGRFGPQNIFTKGSGEVDFLQEYRYGDLRHCELNGYDLMGREAQVNIICGSCPYGASCKDDFGCICNVSYHHGLCRTEVLVAINCSGRGPRILPGFTVGFSPRQGVVVDNGITQRGFYKPFHDYSFGTNQESVSLYMNTIADVASNIGKPLFQVKPAKGLFVELSGMAATGVAQISETPSVLEVNWRCDIARQEPYEVKIVIPLEGSDPSIFFLCKLCENEGKSENNASSGWKNLRLLSCITMVVITTFYCGGIFYNKKVRHKHGLQMLPGMDVLTDCLKKVRGVGISHHLLDDGSDSSLM